MNETNGLLELKSEKEITIYGNRLSLEKSQNNLNDEEESSEIILFKLIIFIIALIFVIIHIYTVKITKKNINPQRQSLINNNNNDENNVDIPKNEDEIENNEFYKIQTYRNEPNCDKLDPINMFNLRIKNGPITICKNGNSKHICYQNNKGYYNDILFHKNGAICLMENFILDPSKAEKTDYIYKGPVDSEKRGFPRLSEGFFNIKCKNPENLEVISEIYDYYFNSWNYNYKAKKGEKIEELAPNKTVLFLSRNQDSPNLFHGNCEILNVISMMKLFNLKPENIQVIFLESITIKNDPFYDIYKNVISRGGEPIYINNLKHKYHITSAIHIPINWDSPSFFAADYPSDIYPLPNCHNKPTKTFKLYNDLIDKYFDLSTFKDSFISDNKIFYYPKPIIKNHKSKTTFNKIVTIQWRKVWPKGRKGQTRILGNGPKLANKLASILPKNILIRLVDTAGLHMREQISILRNTDYLIGIHGAGLFLAIFMPTKSIFHEIVPSKNLKVLQMISVLSGHKTYSDLVYAEERTINESEYFFFNVNEFAETILNRMKENNFI